MIKRFIDFIFSIFGILLIFVGISLAVTTSGKSNVLFTIIDVSSISFMLICFIGFTLFAYGLSNFIKLIYIFIFFNPAKVNYQMELIRKNIKPLLDTYYDSGVSGLRNSLPFKKVLPVWQLIIKQMEINLPIQDIKALLRHDVFIMRSQFNKHLKSLNLISNAAPSIGVLGTVIGLIKLLQNMKDTSSIGANMSLALMTTLYGIFIGTIFMQPIIARVDVIKDIHISTYEQAFFFLDLIEDKKPTFYLEENVIDKKKLLKK